MSHDMSSSLSGNNKGNGKPKRDCEWEDASKDLEQRSIEENPDLYGRLKKAKFDAAQEENANAMSGINLHSPDTPMSNTTAQDTQTPREVATISAWNAVAKRETRRADEKAAQDLQRGAKIRKVAEHQRIGNLGDAGVLRPHPHLPLYALRPEPSRTMSCIIQLENNIDLEIGSLVNEDLFVKNRYFHGRLVSTLQLLRGKIQALVQINYGDLARSNIKLRLIRGEATGYVKDDISIDIDFSVGTPLSEVLEENDQGWVIEKLRAANMADIPDRMKLAKYQSWGEDEGASNVVTKQEAILANADNPCVALVFRGRNGIVSSKDREALNKFVTGVTAQEAKFMKTLLQSDRQISICAYFHPQIDDPSVPAPERATHWIQHYFKHLKEHLTPPEGGPREKTLAPYRDEEVQGQYITQWRHLPPINIIGNGMYKKLRSSDVLMVENAIENNVFTLEDGMPSIVSYKSQSPTASPYSDAEFLMPHLISLVRAHQFEVGKTAALMGGNVSVRFAKTTSVQVPEGMKRSAKEKVFENSVYMAVYLDKARKMSIPEDGTGISVMFQPDVSISTQDMLPEPESAWHGHVIAPTRKDHNGPADFIMLVTRSFKGFAKRALTGQFIEDSLANIDKATAVDVALDIRIPEKDQQRQFATLGSWCEKRKNLEEIRLQLTFGALKLGAQKTFDWINFPGATRTAVQDYEFLLDFLKNAKKGLNDDQMKIIPTLREMKYSILCVFGGFGTAKTTTSAMVLTILAVVGHKNLSVAVDNNSLDHLTNKTADMCDELADICERQKNPDLARRLRALEIVRFLPQVFERSNLKAMLAGGVSSAGLTDKQDVALDSSESHASLMVQLKEDARCQQLVLAYQYEAANEILLKKTLADDVETPQYLKDQQFLRNKQASAVDSLEKLQEEYQLAKRLADTRVFNIRRDCQIAYKIQSMLTNKAKYSPDDQHIIEAFENSKKAYDDLQVNTTRKVRTEVVDDFSEQSDNIISLVLKHADMVFTTYQNSLHELLMESGFLPDTGVHEELGRTKLWQFLLLRCGWPSLDVDFGIGDGNQIKPTVTPAEVDEFSHVTSDSTMGYLRRAGFVLRDLMVGYRCHPEIAAFSNAQWYENKMTFGKMETPEHMKVFTRYFNSEYKSDRFDLKDGKQYFLLDVPNSICMTPKGETSLENWGEAQAVADGVEGLYDGVNIPIKVPVAQAKGEHEDHHMEDGEVQEEAFEWKENIVRILPSQITILVYYKLQIERIKSELKKRGFNESDYPEFKLTTIDAYQSLENDYVFICLVRTVQPKRWQSLMTGERFISNDRDLGELSSFVRAGPRLNVGLTRAKYGEVFVGNFTSIHRVYDLVHAGKATMNFHKQAVNTAITACILDAEQRGLLATDLRTDNNPMVKFLQTPTESSKFHAERRLAVATHFGSLASFAYERGGKTQEEPKAQVFTGPDILTRASLYPPRHRDRYYEQKKVSDAAAPPKAPRNRKQEKAAKKERDRAKLAGPGGTM